MSTANESALFMASSRRRSAHLTISWTWLASKPDGFGKRATLAMEKAFHEQGLLIRITGDTIALTPPLIVGENEIGEMFAKVGRVIEAVR